MTADQPVMLAATELCRVFAADAGYGLAYGSHPAGTAGPDSDLDLVIVTPARLGADTVHRLVQAACDLHRQYGLALDTEVAHAVKLHASFGDIDAATSLRCFPVTDDGEVDVPAVVAEPWFLNSEQFRLRLLLNALTSPHAFLGGDRTAHTRHRRHAELAVALLALSLRRDVPTITLADAASALTIGPLGETYKDFLGYRDGPRLRSTLRRGLRELAARGVVRALDGVRCHQDSSARKAAALRLGLSSTTEWCGPGRMAVGEGGCSVE